MKDELKRLLTPADDGRAFTDAVLLRASGALHRRSGPARGWSPRSWRPPPSP